MNEYKRFVQKAGLVGMTNLFISISGLIFIPIITKNFSAIDYGIWAQANTTIALIPNMANLGLPYTMARFLSSETNKSNIKESFYSMLATVFVLSLIISSLFIIFKNPIANSIFEGNTNIVYIISIITFFSCMNLMFITFFRTFQQIRKYSLFLVLQSYIGVTLSSYLALTGHSIETVIIGIFIGYLSVFIMMGWIIGGHLGLAIPRFKNIKEELEFGIPIIPSNVSLWAIDSIDKYIIGMFLGSAPVGYYSLSYIIGNALLIFLSPFVLLLPSILPKYFEEGNLKQVNIFLKYSMKYFLIIIVPAAIGISLISKQVLMMISTPEIAINGYLITPFACLGAIFVGMYGIVNNILILEKKTKLLGKIWVFVCVLNIIVSIIIVQYIGIIGIAIVTLICYSIAFLITIYHSKKYLDLPFEYKSLIKTIISAIIMGLFVSCMNPNGLMNLIITIIIAIFIYFIVLFLIKGIEKEEFHFFKQMINKI